LSPAKTPGWGSEIGRRPWQRTSTLRQPDTLLVFADTLLASFGSGLPGNTALLDPPLLYSEAASNGVGGAWTRTPSPTTAFRHAHGFGSTSPGTTNATHADGHVKTIRAHADWLTSQIQGIGSIGGLAGMTAQYVPDWEAWAEP
jgi:hypothetical protein